MMEPNPDKRIVQIKSPTVIDGGVSEQRTFSRILSDGVGIRVRGHFECDSFVNRLGKDCQHDRNVDALHKRFDLSSKLRHFRRLIVKPSLKLRLLIVKPSLKLRLLIVKPSLKLRLLIVKPSLKLRLLIVKPSLKLRHLIAKLRSKFPQ
jgi:hypothetical protein